MKRIIAILTLSLASSVVFAEEAAGKPAPNPSDRPVEQSSEELTNDPVCMMQLRKPSAEVHAAYGGEDYWFCSKNCYMLFLRKPERYASKHAVEVEAGLKADTSDKNLKSPAADQKPETGPDESNLRNSEWRGLLHSANQVREAAMTIMVLAVTLFAVLVLGALVVFTAGIAPNAVARASVVTRDHPIRSFVVGAVALAFGSMATIATKGILGIIFVPVLTSALLIGLAGVSEHLGRNLCHLSGKEGNRIGHIAAGWTTFSLVSVVPLVGWFGFFPYYCAVGVGAFFSNLRGGRKTTEAYDRA